MGTAGGIAHSDGSLLLIRVLLNDDEVGAVRHGSAGEDADGFAPADAPAETGARKRLSGNLERDRNR